MTLLLMASIAIALFILTYLALLDSSYKDIAQYSLTSAFGLIPYLLQVAVGVALGNFHGKAYAPRHLVA